MWRSPSDRVLKRWLATGRPRRVARVLETDPSVSLRLEELTALDDKETEALSDAVTPSDDFEQRVLAGVQERQANGGAVSVVADLMGLGFHVARALMEPVDDRSRDDD